MKLSKKIIAILATSIAFTSFAEVKTYTLTANQLMAKENTMSTYWYQTSVEAKALYLQGYKLATKNLTNILKKHHNKPYAIVLDIDETVLDNSPYQVQNIKDGTGFNPKTWDEWVQLGVAKAVPGAKEFLNFANKNKVKIYYISDRDDNQIDVTIKNMKKEGLPVQGRDHLLFKGMGTKVERMNIVKKHSNIVMLFGDNICDFGDFSKTSMADRQKKLDELKAEFGDRFIIFPNPMYGSFERTIYKEKNAKTTEEKMEVKHNLLKGYK